MIQQFPPPITPPPELFAEWLAKAKQLHPRESTGFIAGEVARLAYQAGADQELEACCEWLEDPDLNVDTYKLRAARRPKPSSLKEQAIEDLDLILGYIREQENYGNLWCDSELTTIRRALEQLPDEQ